MDRKMNHNNNMKFRFSLFLVMSLISFASAGEEAELNDFVGGVYDGDGTYATAGNVAVGAHGAIIKAGDTYFTPKGVYVKCGDSYISPHRTVVRAGDSFVGYGTSQVKAGDVFVGQATAISSGSTIFRKSWASR
jgi:hypothetical protein